MFASVRRMNWIILVNASSSLPCREASDTVRSLCKNGEGIISTLQAFGLKVTLRFTLTVLTDVFYLYS
ncbi:MAG: hypothetical protein JW704_14005, partial [Anaerolineaceae bacterium]|nr:hypothetical protein [Anaerolineaceae bacterium]